MKELAILLLITAMASVVVVDDKKYADKRFLQCLPYLLGFVDAFLILQVRPDAGWYSLLVIPFIAVLHLLVKIKGRLK